MPSLLLLPCLMLMLFLFILSRQHNQQTMHVAPAKLNPIPSHEHTAHLHPPPE
jgi:hypothetical protein